MLANFFYNLAVRFGYKPQSISGDALLIGTKVLTEYQLQQTNPQTDIGITVYFLADKTNPDELVYEIY